MLGAALEVGVSPVETPTTAMTHIAIQKTKDGKVVEWMEKVSDEEYLVGPAS